jgi:hypothetical protein
MTAPEPRAARRTTADFYADVLLYLAEHDLDYPTREALGQLLDFLAPENAK